MMSKVEQVKLQIDNNSIWSWWNSKVREKVMESLMPNESYPPESLVKHWASEIIFDYHDTVYNGPLSANNRNPNDEDLDLFTKIIITILYEYGLVGEFENFDERYGKIKPELKKRVEASDRYEMRN